jgi:hypothetical protein
LYSSPLYLSESVRERSRLRRHLTNTVKSVPWRAQLLFAGLTAARVAVADPEPIRISYAAPGGCPAETEMVAQLAQHAAITRVDTGDARSFDLAITRDVTGFHGELVVARSGDAPAKREVSAPSCDEVVTALVLVAALAIEEHPPGPPTVPLDRPPSPPEVHRVVGRVQLPTADTPWRFAIGAGVARYAGITPSVRFGVPIYINASRGPRQVRATFDTTTSDDLASASFRWTAGRVEGCPHTWSSGRFAAAPCAGVQIGVLYGKGTAMVANSTSDKRPWIAPELVARLAVALGHAQAEVEGTVAAPLERDRYYFAPMTTVHRVAALTEGVAISLAIQFR